MTTIKIYKRGNKVLFPGISGENILKDTLRNLEFDRLHKVWCTEATLTVFRDLWKKYKDNFVLTDEETNKWVQKSRVTIVRMGDLQTGLTEENRPVELPNVIDYVLPPYQHQKEAIAYALNIPKCFLMLDLGLGKTYTSITIAKLRHAIPTLGGINKVLVICPRSLMYQWEQEINRLAPDAKVFPVKGTPQHKEHIIDSIPQDGFSFTLITYEAIWAALPWLEAVGFDMFILDESTKMKNPKAKRTQSTSELCTSIPYGLALSGMPYVSNPLDLFAQFLALDATVYGSNQWVFSNRYIDYITMPFGRMIRGFKHMDELKERTYLVAFGRMKDQCLDLPAKVYQTRKLPIYESQYQWYCNLLEQIEKIYEIQDELLETSTTTQEPQVTVEYVVAMLEKFQQITSGFITTDTGEIIWLDSPKYEEMLSILNSSTDSFIIWARHSLILKKIESYLAAHEIKATVLDRRVSDERRKVIKEQFKQGKIKVLILQIQSECRGNDFTCETNSVSSIFFENTASIEERSQAEDRQHRIGMKGTAVYIDLVCEDTYDEGIKMLLENKRRISEYIRRKELDILLGKCGSIGLKKTKSKKKPKTPEELKAEQPPEDIMNADMSELGLCC